MYNFHTHSNFCDGTGAPEEYVLSALGKGFKSLGFSGHAPTPIALDWTLTFENLNAYFDAINLLKEKYREKIEIYLGLEFDYYEEKRFQKFYFQTKDRLDFNISSVHFIYDKRENKFYIIDGKIESYIDALKNIFNENVVNFVSSYYSLVRKMIVDYSPDIVAHIDLIKKNNRNSTFFSERANWYKKEILLTLDVLSKSSSLLEINTGGIARGSINDFYPSEWLFKECYKRNIPLIINSDSHTPQKIDAYFEEARKALKKAGYSTQVVLLKNRWTEVEI
ncbi:MAG: histidinol-phosphatase [Brevinematia bacterium]